MMTFLEKILKRCLDLVGGIIGLVLSIPIFCIAAVAIKLDSPGPVFYSHERAGINGKPFRFYKLRSMVVDADRQAAEVLVKQSHIQGAAYKVQNDPRITRVGRFLRRWSLDELPQFLNVIKGEMSLVGPRPDEIWVVAQYSEQERKRLGVKPGLTGPMQISGRGDLNMEQRLALEMDYIQNYSFRKDLEIILKSVRVVLSGKGAY